MTLRRPVLASMLFVVALASIGFAAELTQREIEERLTCQCGCGLTVANCNHMQCGFAVPVRKAIAEGLARGETGDQIIAGYVSEYGEKVLSSPVAEGFNILAWIGPYIVVGCGAVLLVLSIRRWSTRARSASGGRVEPASGASDAARLRLARELEELER